MVNEEPLLSVEEVKRVQDCQALYWQEHKKVLRLAEGSCKGLVHALVCSAVSTE